MTQPPSNNSLVSVRMPKSMFNSLQKLAEKNHFLDVSEQVRSIVRDRWSEAKDPQTYQIRKLRKDIAAALGSDSDMKAQERLIKELERIKQNLTGEGNRK